MALTETAQVFELLKKSRQILIIIRKDWTGDAVSSALALAEFFRSLSRRVDIICQDFKQSSNFSYLPLSLIQPVLGNLQKFVVSVDMSQTGLGEFEYDESENRLNFYITPKTGQLTKDNISSAASGFKYDLIITLATPDLEALGEAYGKHGDFFYSTPKINVDNNPQNEYYGNINLVNIAASSTAEIVYDLIREYDENLINDNVATYLLSGIITATKNFKSPAVTPKTLALAGYLIGRGARRDQIIQNLYQNRFLSTLKLWGRVLSRLNNDLNDKIIWSVLSLSDFLETSTNAEELPDVVEELIVSMPKTEIIVLLYEDRRGEQVDIKVLIYSVKNRDAVFLSRKFNPQGNKDLARFTLTGVTLAEAEHQVIEEIKKQLV
jgi:nanoRNase/pAp phosphatase (c-di-AMP/oligoRNAs hydrolase)